MSKSIKLKDNTYLDSNGITHNRNILSTLLNNIITNITNISRNIDNINNNLSNIFETITSTDITVTGLTAGSSGYKEYTITIPAGYTAYFIGFTGNGQIANLFGLQLTCVYQPFIVNNTEENETITCYLTYYSPKTISRANTKINAIHLLIKNTFIQ